MTPHKKMERAPDVDGLALAWEADLPAVRKVRGDGEDATLAIWMIEAPWAHPVWHSYALIFIHLRPVSPPVETIFYLPGATHEVWLYACNPDLDRECWLSDLGAQNGRGPFLSPKNFASQMVYSSDEEARVEVRRAVNLVCAGRLSPDTDHVRDWQAIFGDWMFKDRIGGTRPVML